jgi:RNA polymerase sigma factor (sigma-70 family)
VRHRIAHRDTALAHVPRRRIPDGMVDVATPRSSPALARAPATPPDAELLAEFVASRCDAAFAAIVARHAGMIRRASMRILADAHAADDVTQAVLMVLARRASEVRGEELGAWLHGVSVRESWTARRSRATRARHERNASESLRSPDADQAGLERMRSRLDEALASLPPEQHQAVVLCHLEGHSQQEAALIAGCALGTMAWRTSAGIKRLRRLLGLEGAAGEMSLATLLDGELTHAASAHAATAAAAAATTHAAGLGAHAILPVTVALLAATVAAVAGATLLPWHPHRASASLAAAASADAPVAAALMAAHRAGPHGVLPSLPGTDIPDFAVSPTIVSVTDGAWSSPQAWSPARTPHAGDIVAIRTDIAFDLVSDERIATVAIQRGGALRMLPDRATRLTTDTLLVEDGGALRVAPEAATAAQAEIVLGEAAPADDDPLAYRGGLIVLGTAELIGAERTPFMRLASEPHRGDALLRLAAPVAGWQAGDQLLLPDSRQRDSGKPPVPDQEDAVVIAGVSADGTSVTLASPLLHDHPGARDADGRLRFLPHVADLTRSVLVRSDAPGGRRGFAWCGRRAELTARGAAFVDLGRGGPQDGASARRNALCLAHVLGRAQRSASTPGFIVDDCVVRSGADGSVADAIAIVGSHDGQLSRTIVDHWAGAGIIASEGCESRNRIVGNFITRIRGSGALADGMGRSGCGIFLRGPDNEVRDNVVAQLDGWPYGCGIAIDACYAPAGRRPTRGGADPTEPGASEPSDPNALPIRALSGNEVYGVTGEGYRVGWLGTHYLTPLGPAGAMSDDRVWHHCSWAMYASETNGLRIDGFQALCDTGLMNPAQGLLFIEPQRHLLITGADVEGAAGGIMLPSGEDIEVRDSTLRNDTDVASHEMGTSNGGAGLPPRLITLRNVICRGIPGRSHTAIARAVHDLVLGGGYNVLQRDRLLVRSFDGRSGDDFELFFEEQRADFVLPLQKPMSVAAPRAGLSNAAAWRELGIAFAGAIAPASAHHRDGISGLVAPIAP